MQPTEQVAAYIKNCVLSIVCIHSIGLQDLASQTIQKVCVWCVFESHTYSLFCVLFCQRRINQSGITSNSSGRVFDLHPTEAVFGLDHSPTPTNTFNH